MYKKTILLMLAVSFCGLKANSAKKYSFALVQEAESKFAKQIKEINMIQAQFKKRLDAFVATVDKEGFISMSVEDKRKLQFLLKQLIAYK